MPRVDVGVDVAHPAARRVIFNEPSGIKLSCERYNVGDPSLSFRKILLILPTSGVRAAGNVESPSLVERNPREDRRVVVVAPDHLTERVLDL